MNTAAVFNAALYIAAGFASGAVLYSVYLPKLIRGVDVTLVSADKNPGAYNAFVYGGVPVGILCLLLDILKGYVPVLLANRAVDSGSLAFAGVLFAPVAGHVFSPLRRFHGGKGISVSFGVLLGMFPGQLIVLVLAAAYLISLLLPLRINERRTLIAFAVLAAAGALMNNPLSVKIGCVLIALLVCARNWHDAKIPPILRRKEPKSRTNDLAE
jgi:acyl phosphate:glycerol-3-phosphate acyltransferase